MNFFQKIFSCKQNLNEFKILFDISPSVIIQCDKKGYITYANKTFEEKFGYPLNEFKEKIFVGDLYKGGIEEARKIMRLLKSKEYGGVGKLVDYETVGLTRYGEEIPFLVNASLIYKNGKEVGTAGYLFDVSNLILFKKELEKQKERFRSLLENASIGMFIIKNNKFIYFNKKFQELIGYSEKRLKDLNFTQILGEKYREIFDDISLKIINNEIVKLPLEAKLKRKDDQTIYVELFLNRIKYDDDISLQGFVNDITKRKLLEIELRDVNKKLKELSIRDELTGVFNFRYFREMLKLKYLESKRYNTPLGLIIIDIDDFKNVNDTYGHLAGDFVLKNVAKIILNSVRNIDIVSRYGGDEFILILPNATDNDLIKIAERILNNIKSFDFWYELNKINVTVSIGMSSFVGKEELIKNEDDLLRFADEALYTVKNHKGKNNIFLHDGG